MSVEKKILIIDDETDLCLLLKDYFIRKHYNVFLSHTLSDGAKILNDIHPDILFLDNNLPDGLGVNNIVDIKTIAPNAALIMITAMGNSREEALQKGVDIFLEKPLTSTNIKDVLLKITSKQDTEA